MGSFLSKLTLGFVDSEGVFRLTDDYIKNKIDSDGRIFLPSGKKIRKLVVEASEESAKRIRTLLLEGNPVLEMEAGEKLVNVVDVVGEKCGFSEIPSWIADLSGLKRLFLDQNEITEIPPFIAYRTALKELNLSNNQITEIPPRVTANLTLLDLTNCDVQSLPHDFFHHRLETVYLSKNKGK